ncbi:cupin domain-containing protein [Halomonas sp. M4R5S39]|uniref:cupin domain-containing protein n=1 Tax=Halomonas kalidii TaxID=3043293 RepID=UPI0024A84072|nr:cupin domain-containing protein [Halomonas kalidii]MDI5985519.1 cupin domain-containing protein [Halomonas kalidii]
MKNLFASIPDDLDDELFEEIVRGETVRVERIVSRGHSSPAEGWHDQSWHEWVLVLEGGAILAFEDGEEVTLGPGDHLEIAAHRKHRVKWTAPERATLWLAVHYPA